MRSNTMGQNGHDSGYTGAVGSKSVKGLVIGSIACEGAPLSTAISRTRVFLNKHLNLYT